MSIYFDLRERASKSPNSQFLKVPLVPSLGMVLAAAKATNVFRPGDAVTDYFASYEIDYGPSGENIYVHPDLVAKYGMQMAYCLAVIADIWSNCLLGVDRWLTSRARHGRAPNDGEDTICFLPEHCPPGGYPPTKSACTQEHIEHSRCIREAFKAYGVDWYQMDRETMTVVPRRLPYQAAIVAARTYLSVASFLEFPDVIDWRMVPYVPNYSKDRAFTDEERHELVLAAIWRACIEWLLSEDQLDAKEFPTHPNAQAVIMSHAIDHHGDINRHIGSFIEKHPYKYVSITSDRAVLTLATAGGKSSYCYQEADTGVLVWKEGLLLQPGYDQSGLREILSKISRQRLQIIEAIPL